MQIHAETLIHKYMLNQNAVVARHSNERNRVSKSPCADSAYEAVARRLRLRLELLVEDETDHLLGR